MAFNLKSRHLLSLAHHSTEEIEFLVRLAAQLKEAKYSGAEQPMLEGKNIALIFEKASTRTRCAFEVAAHDQGAHVTYLGPSGSHIGHKESMKDTARVLGRMYDGIEYRGFHQSVVEELAEYAGVPVFNGLTDEFHPTQMLADALTMQEDAHKPFHQISFAYVGDGRNNMGRSLLLLGAKLGMDVRIGAPEGLQPDSELVEQCQEWAEESGGKVLVTASAEEAVRDVDFIHTDVWVSMGEPVESWGERVDTLMPFQVNDDLVAAANNPRVKVMHCLPAFHNSETAVGAEIAETYPQLANGIEVTESVFESSACIAFDQAENRMHTIKAVMVASLA